MVQQQVQLPTPQLKGVGLRIGMLVPRYKLHSINVMFSRAYEVLTQCGVKAEDIHVVSVPNFYELATVVQTMLARDVYDVIICLGTTSGATRNVIQGSTDKGFQWVAFYHDIPVIFSRPGTKNTSLQEQVECAAEYARTAIRMAQITHMRKVS